MYTQKDISPSNKLHLDKHKAYDQSKLMVDYELDKCINWISQTGASIVCLQFSPDYLHNAPYIVSVLEKELQRKVYVLGDTSYGSCCVDEIAAQHVNADAIIHFGHSCLSPSERIPVLYVFNKENLNISEFMKCFHQTFQCEDKICLLYDVCFHHEINGIRIALEKDYMKLIVAKLVSEETLVPSTKCWFGRVIDTTSRLDFEEYKIVFIGRDGPCSANFKYLFPKQTFFIFSPETSTLGKYEINLSKFLQKRMFLIECLKEAKNIGILIGTLCIKNYLKAIERIKCLTKPRGIKCYIISVGRINVAKLSNFPEINAFVLITCAENSLLDSKEFLQPIITPYEVELAFNAAYTWSEKYVTDFTTLLPGCVNYIEESFKSTENETNVSLVSCVQNCSNNSTNEEKNAIVVKDLDNLALSESHGSVFLTSRSWMGLEPKLGQNSVKKVTLGRSGLPCKYENENAG